jgi:pimeloyl-ACP methyl ester carboxylesterase
MEQATSPDGTRIAYRRSGSGRPLLLVHGSSADHRRWSPILPYLEGDFTVYAMDRRGRGMSGDAPDYHLRREAEDVTAVVEAAFKQTGEPVSVLGHSFGALCSLEAARLTDKVRRLSLYEPPLAAGLPVHASGLPGRMQALIESGEPEAALELFIREEVKMPEHELAIYRQLPMWPERIKIVPTVLRELLAERAYRFDGARFAEIQVPTLLLLGGDSPPLFRQATEMLEAALPCSRVVVMPGQQHIAMDTNPDLFAREVRQFLRAEQAELEQGTSLERRN